PQKNGRDATDLDLVRDVGRAEDRGGEADEGGEHDEEDVEVVDDQELAAPPSGEQQRHPGREGERAGDHVDDGAQPIVGDERQHRTGDRRDQQQHLEGVGIERAHVGSRRSPRKLSSALTSTVSKRSRMRKTNTPNTMKAIRIENATENSNTSGM